MRTKRVGKNTIRGSKGLGSIRVAFTRTPNGTTYVYPAWWGIDEEGHVLTGPQPSERKLRAEVAMLRRRIAAGEYTPR